MSLRKAFYSSPYAGENEADDGKRFPSDLSKSTAIKKTARNNILPLGKW
jgi:hypothetical protein